MSDQEKINIYISDAVYKTLVSDVKLFEITKKDGMSPNMNRFLSMLIRGYYETYAAAYSMKTEAILKAMETHSVRCRNRELFAQKLMEDVMLNDTPEEKERHSGHLSLKPTQETEWILQEIKDGAVPASRYLCRMLESYCKKPLFVREQIVFRDQYTMLLEACKKKKVILFSVKGDPTRVYQAVPYEVVPGNDEMLNYFLCQETSGKTGKCWASSFRLSRITHLRFTGQIGRIDQQVLSYLETMKRYGAQDAINDTGVVCVRLSAKGLKLYNRMYYRRPIFDKREEREDGTYLFFKCSKKQIFLYFKRFEFRDAEVIEPRSMYEDLKKFHIRAIESAVQDRGK